MILQWLNEGNALKCVYGKDTICVERKFKGARSWTVKIGRKWVGDLHSKEAAKAAGIVEARNRNGALRGA